jgi:hypothetical protein
MGRYNYNIRLFRPGLCEMGLLLIVVENSIFTLLVCFVFVFLLFLISTCFVSLKKKWTILDFNPKNMTYFNGLDRLKFMDSTQLD